MQSGAEAIIASAPDLYFAEIRTLTGAGISVSFR
jgi:hypothetical protein